MAAAHRPALVLRRPTFRIRSPRLIMVVACALVIAGALLQVNQFSAVTGTGYEIEELKRERAAKQAANHDLERDLAWLSSLARVEIEARTRLGMTPAPRTMHLQIVGRVPEHQTLPTRFLPAPLPAESPNDRSLFQRLLDLLPF